MVFTDVSRAGDFFTSSLTSLNLMGFTPFPVRLSNTVYSYGVGISYPNRHPEHSCVGSYQQLFAVFKLNGDGLGSPLALRPQQGEDRPRRLRLFLAGRQRGRCGEAKHQDDGLRVTLQNIKT